LLVVIDYQQFIRDGKRRNVQFQSLESADIPIGFEKFRTVLFDDRPIKHIQDLLLRQLGFRTLHQKNILLYIVEIASILQVVYEFIHFLIGKIFIDDTFQDVFYFGNIYEPPHMLRQTFNNDVEILIRHKAVKKPKIKTIFSNNSYKKNNTFFPHKIKRFFYCI